MTPGEGSFPRADPGVSSSATQVHILSPSAESDREPAGWGHSREETDQLALGGASHGEWSVLSCEPPTWREKERQQST